jgi:hypothetical protein
MHWPHTGTIFSVQPWRGEPGDTISQTTVCDRNRCCQRRPPLDDYSVSREESGHEGPIDAQARPHATTKRSQHAASGGGLITGLAAEQLTGLGRERDASGRLHSEDPIAPLRDGSVAVPFAEQGHGRPGAGWATGVRRCQVGPGNQPFQISLETSNVGLEPTEWCRRTDWQPKSTPPEVESGWPELRTTPAGSCTCTTAAVRSAQTRLTHPGPSRPESSHEN